MAFTSFVGTLTGYSGGQRCETIKLVDVFEIYIYIMDNGKTRKLNKFGRYAMKR